MKQSSVPRPHVFHFHPARIPGMPSMRLVFSLHTLHVCSLIFKHMKTLGLAQARAYHLPFCPFPGESHSLTSEASGCSSVTFPGCFSPSPFPQLSTSAIVFLTMFLVAHSFAATPWAPSGLSLKPQFLGSHLALGRNLYPRTKLVANL